MKRQTTINIITTMMMSTILAFIIIIATTSTYALDLHTLIQDEPLVLDHTVTVCQLDADSPQLTSLLSTSSTPSTTTTTDTSNERYILINSTLTTATTSTVEDFAQSTAKHVASLGFKVCLVKSLPDTTTTTTTTTTTAAKLPGDVVITLGGEHQPVLYYGKRDPVTLYRYVQRLTHQITNLDTVVQPITNRLEKKAFEKVYEPKVVAYFPDSTAPAFVEYQRAAAQLSPNLPFYVIHDPHLASKFRLTQPGAIALMRRMEKFVSHFPSTSANIDTTIDGGAQQQQPLTASAILTWIASNRGLIIHELDDTNMYDPELLDRTKYQLVAIGDRHHSPMGRYLFKLLTKTIQNVSKENEQLQTLISGQSLAEAQAQMAQNGNFRLPRAPAPIQLDDVEIVWIDLRLFPNAAQKLIQHQQQQIATDPAAARSSLGLKEQVYFGLIQVPDTLVASLPNQQQPPPKWFDLSLLLDVAQPGQSSVGTTASSSQSGNGGGKRTEEQNIATLREWILTSTGHLAVVADAVPADPAASRSEQTLSIEVMQQRFILEPESISVRTGASFILDCRVQYRAGECLWLKNGQPVVVTAIDDHHDDPHAAYHWVSPVNDIEDCSLNVIGANAERDAGEWQCVVTQTTMPSTGEVVVNGIKSKVIQVQVRPPSAAAGSKDQQQVPASSTPNTNVKNEL